MNVRETGVTLIELMIGLLLISLVLFGVVPLTSGWVDNARWDEARGLMEQAVGRAKANALRNPHGVSGDAATAAALCVSGGQLSVKQAQAPDAPASCTAADSPVWQAQLPPRAKVQEGGADLSCLCFNNRGGLITSSSACGGGCGTSLTLSVIAGAENETVSFF